MSMFRDALIGVWCLSWHPASDEIQLESLSAVIRNNRQAHPGQRKSVLLMLGHQSDDVLTMVEAHPQQEDSLHGVAPGPMCQSAQLARQMGWKPAWHPVGIESAERWEWMMAED